MCCEGSRNASCNGTNGHTAPSQTGGFTCRYHALLATRFAIKFPTYQECFEECFRRQYSLIHRLETNKLRNVAKFFGALLEQDAISWQVLESIRLTQDDTTSSSRIFIKILFQVCLRTHRAHPSALLFSRYMGAGCLCVQSCMMFPASAASCNRVPELSHR